MFNLFKKKEEKTDENAELDVPMTQQFQTGFEESLYYADHGNIIEATHVGISYHYGIEKGNEEHPAGIEPNLELAIKYLNMAAKKGYLKAQVELGMLYYTADSDVFDKEKGFEWLSLTAKRGDSFSQFVLGHHYQNGELLPQDEELAYHWFLESASNGEVEAMLRLAQIYKERAEYLMGKDCFTEEEKIESWNNAELSFKWYKKAADEGEVDAIFWVGVYYFAGFGVPIDKNIATTYLDLAISNGSQVAVDFKNKHFSMEEL